MPSEWLNEDARSEERCGVFCDAEPDVEFTDEWGVTNRVCRDCYDRQCGRCSGDIRDEYKRKGLCQGCRDEIRMWSGDAERGIEKDPDSEQTTLITDGGEDQIKHDRTCDACGATTFAWERCHRCGDIPWRAD